MYGFGKQHLLRLALLERQTVEILFIEYADVCAVLVDNHKPRLHGCHDILALVLVVRRRLLGYDAVGAIGLGIYIRRCASTKGIAIK